jgi:UDP-N-acetylglucosamine--N-acetylmuramyl-(pentapeptide) pyrophosphoryl-undecaprenol N-acetylglucosamine transferase
LQFIHLTGNRDVEVTRAAYAAQNCRAVVRASMSEMGLALAAADAAVSRAGASSLAELAARQLPAVLIPYPFAADNHQDYNAHAFVQSGAARVVHQQSATPELVAREILELIVHSPVREAMRRALARWHGRDAAATIAECILNWPDRHHRVPTEAHLNSHSTEALNV